MLKTALRIINNNHGFWQVAAPIIASVAGSAIGGLLNNKGQEDANEANVKLWREQAAYNTPANQMKRYKEAGLNPYLAISGGNPGNMANIPEQKPVQRGEMYNKMFDNLSTLMQARNLGAQNENLHQQNKLLHAQTAQTENSTSMHTMDTLAKIEKLKAETNNEKVRLELNRLDRQIRERDNAINIRYNQPSSAQDSTIRTAKRRLVDAYRFGTAIPDVFKGLYNSVRKNIPRSTSHSIPSRSNNRTVPPHAGGTKYKFYDPIRGR